MSYFRFQLFRSAADHQYYFRLKAGDDRILLSSEGYTAKSSCLHGIDSVKRNADNDDRYSRKDNPGSYRFNLKAANGEIIGRSKAYVTSEEREKDINALKAYAPGALTEDIT